MIICFVFHLKDYKYVHEAKKTLCQYLSHRRHHAAIRPSFGRGWIHSTLCIYDRVSNARCVHCTYEMNTHTRHMTRGCGLTDRCESSPSLVCTRVWGRDQSIKWAWSSKNFARYARLCYNPPYSKFPRSTPAQYY